MKRLIIIMGVSGCGKSTISRALGQSLNFPVIEGDDFHPAVNIQKMTGGAALDDTDRRAWLNALNKEIEQQLGSNIVLACSALTSFVQQELSNVEGRNCIWIWLEGAPDLIRKRLKARQGHFMTDALLESQFEALTPPKNCHRLSVDKPIKALTKEIAALITALDEEH